MTLVLVVCSPLLLKYPREVQAIPGQLNVNALTGTIQNFSQVGIGGDVTGGSAKLYVNGNVGIGTTGPGSLLDVAGAAKIRGTSNGVEVLNLGTAGAINAVVNTADEMYFNIDSDNNPTGASFHFGHNLGTSAATELYFTP